MEVDNFKATLEDLSYDPQKDIAYLIVYKDCLEHVQKSFLFFIRRTYTEEEMKKLIEEKINMHIDDTVKKLPREIYEAENAPEDLITDIERLIIEDLR